MAKKPEQMDLIDVLPENAKKLKALIRKREGIKSEQKDLREQLDAVDENIIAQVKESGVAPDIDGVWTVKVSAEETIRITPGKAEPKITVIDTPKAEKKDEEAVDDAAEGNTPAPQSRTR